MNKLDRNDAIHEGHDELEAFKCSQRAGFEDRVAALNVRVFAGECDGPTCPSRGRAARVERDGPDAVEAAAIRALQRQAARLRRMSPDSLSWQEAVEVARLAVAALSLINEPVLQAQARRWVNCCMAAHSWFWREFRVQR